MHRAAPSRTAWPAAPLRLALAPLVVVALAAGLAGGLARAGVGLPAALAGDWLGPAAMAHAFLMVCAFMGTVIGVERAVAVRHPLAFAGPLASGVAGAAALCGWPASAAWLAAAAALAFVAVNVAVVMRQRAAHTVLLLVGALAWAAGCLLHALGALPGAVVPWWFAFLVLTIAAERLEMTRLMRRRRGAAPALHAVLGALLLGAGLSAVWPVEGGVLYGLALAALAAWLLAFDIARRTVRAQGLSRYMAVCLLLGYVWLGVAGCAWTATALGLPWRDAALHALALGFVFGMMLGHAPVILPAVARVKVLFGWPYYLPLVLLHGSLAVRLLAVHADARALAAGAAGNALAIALFAATIAGSALAWGRR
ncbi:hypothetical protein [Xylophilus sp.]|uniref:hypothetical protein n=1 Tax=Xylophilus sp. TaxID=2653893 RepID=UPI0013BA52F0|nr:hypothetical protein [Xylophilus sp.]KAF1049143.1 MAG: hypothetical protein GAK38_00911 [Xylophilus sp.]